MLRVLSLLLLWAPLCLAAEHPRLFSEKLASMETEVRLAIADGRLPGGVLWVEREGDQHHVAIGRRAVEPAGEAMTEDTIFDSASLTKVLATTPAVMKLVESGKIDLDATVATYLPEFSREDQRAVKVRHLLTHTSGLKSGIAAAGWQGIEGAVQRACSVAMAAKPETEIRYSDLNFILLGEIVRRVSGQALDVYCREHFYVPLGMTSTSYLPASEWRARVAPTTRGTERGVVHDPTARLMGGVAGHAGLFTTAADVARFARMLLGGGELEGVRVLQPETVKAMTSVQSADSIPARRGLGWDIDSGHSGPRGKWLPLGSYGHTGWTGGSLWIDPFSRTFIVFLSNRNHPTEDGNVLPLRRTLGTLAAEAVREFNFLHVPGALPPRAGGTIALEPRELRGTTVLTGIDVLVRDQFVPLQGLKIGLITNHTGIDRQRRRTIDLLAKAKDVKLVALFGPEHGIAGKVDEKFGDTRDPETNLPVFSLYGDRRAPTPEQIAELDALVFDIQDVGCRFYTYSSTLGECLAAAARAGKKFFVLDRPNPISGATVEGPVLDGVRSFTAWHEVPLRHGLTLGELARMYNLERKLGADLTVIACEGWSRGQWFDETDLPWVDPSPNMRSLTAALLYPGVGLLEFCQLSVGRGTDRPFEFVGAPYIDDLRFAAELNSAELEGVRFIPRRLTPSKYIFANKDCGGAEIVVTDRTSVSAVDVGLEIARALQRLYPDKWDRAKLAKLLVHPATEAAVRDLTLLPAIHASWLPPREDYLRRRQQVLLYR